jgi:tripartite-type tricarboxylate transporter receptor subunit TctC
MNNTSMIKYLSLALLTFVLVFLMITPFVLAADYPKRAIAIVVGSSPGGGFDLQGRLFCKHWPRYLPKKVPMIIRNITGGGGVRSANQVWKAKPDGYTIVQLKTGPYILSEILYPDQIKFKMKKWQYIGRYTYDVSVLLARADLVEKLKTYQDLMKFGKKKPLKGVTGGVSSSMHNKQLIFSEASGIPMNFVHFPGAMQALACDEAGSKGNADPIYF